MKKTFTIIITILLFLTISTIALNNDGYHHIEAASVTCPNCGSPAVYYHTITAATCESGGVDCYKCTSVTAVCRDFEVNTPALGHNYVETITEATCTTAGNIHHQCSRCSSSYDETIPALGHYYQYTIINKPTCTKDGLYRYKCIRCTSSYDKKIAAIGHNYEEIENVEPTCLEDGHITTECKNCGDQQTETLKALGHKVELVVTKEATCTEDGVKSGICQNCHEEIKETIPATGHKYPEEWTVDKEPTIFSEGEKSHQCEYCGEVEKEVIAKKDIPVAVPIVGGGVVLGGVALLVLKKTGTIGAKKAAKQVVEETAKKVVEKETLEPSFEEKVIVTSMNNDDALYKAMKVQKYIQVVESEYDEIKNAISENEPALTLIDVSNKDLHEVYDYLKEIHEENEKTEVSLLVSHSQINNQKEYLDNLKNIKFIKNYASIDNGYHVNLIKLILPAMKPKLNSDESLENIGMIADVLHIPGVSSIISAYISGREIKETIVNGEEGLGAADTATIISDMASILGFDKVSSVANLIVDVDDIKTSVEAKIGGNEINTTKDAASDIIDVVKDIIDK